MTMHVEENEIVCLGDPDVIDLDDTPPKLPSPVNNNNRFVIVQGPQGAMLIPDPSGPLKPTAPMLRPLVPKPPTLVRPSNILRTTLVNSSNRPPGVLSNMPVLIPRPALPSQSQILSNKPMLTTANLIRPRLTPIRPPVGATRPTLVKGSVVGATAPVAPRPGSVIMKTFTMEGGVQMAYCPFCNLLFSRETVHQHIALTHRLKPKSVISRKTVTIGGKRTPSAPAAKQDDVIVLDDDDEEELEGSSTRSKSISSQAKKSVPPKPVPSRTFPCPFCPNTFGATELHEHIQKQHQNNSEDEDPLALDDFEVEESGVRASGNGGRNGEAGENDESSMDDPLFIAA